MRPRGGRYDDAIAALGQAGSECGLLDSVHPSKPVRDKAQQLAQRVAEAATALSLNQEVYRALAAVDVSHADEATRHYVERTLLQYRLAGVDKDDATRARLRELQDKATLLGLTIGRNVQEGAHKVEITDLSELDGLPEDFRSNHPPDESGKVVLTTDYPDYLPVMTFATSDALRRRMFLAYNTRAFPANRELLLELFRTRHAIANLLGFATWADFATADQMIGSAANMKQFLERLEAGDARRSAAGVRDHPGLCAQPAAGAGCDRCGQPRLLAGAVSAAGVRLRLAGGAALLPVQAGGGGGAGDGSAAVQGGVPAGCEMRRYGIPRSRRGMSSTGRSAWGGSIWICIRARGRTSGSARRRWCRALRDGRFRRRR